MLGGQVAMGEQSWAATWPTVALATCAGLKTALGKSRELRAQLPARHSSEGSAQGRGTSPCHSSPSSTRGRTASRESQEQLE